MTFGEKIFFGAIVAFFVLIAGSQCSSKNAPAPSSYTPAPAYTPPPPPPPVSPPPKRVGWISVYYSDITNKYSWVVGASSMESAQADAQESCNLRQGLCREWATKQAKCFAIYSNSTARQMSIAFGGTEQKAMDAARIRCESRTGGLCLLDDSIGFQNASKCDSWSD
jgi:hypothetical protein